MRGLWVLALLVTVPAVAGPSVAKDQITRVPEAWRSQWTPFNEAVVAAKAAEAKAGHAVAAADKALERAEKSVDRAQDIEKQTAKAHKQARKAKDPAAAKAAAANKAQAMAAASDARQVAAGARSTRDLAVAEHDLAKAKRVYAEARREQVVAQSVADAGGWAEVARFDEAVDSASAQVTQAEEALVVAQAKSVLTAQGS